MNNRIVVEALDDGFLITTELYTDGQESPEVTLTAAETVKTAAEKVREQLAIIRSSAT